LPHTPGALFIFECPPVFTEHVCQPFRSFLYQEGRKIIERSLQAGSIDVLPVSNFWRNRVAWRAEGDLLRLLLEWPAVVFRVRHITSPQYLQKLW
jgi:hypothetical protein